MKVKTMKFENIPINQTKIIITLNEIEAKQLQGALGENTRTGIVRDLYNELARLKFAE